MKVIVLYRPKSERASMAEGFIAEFTHRNPTQQIESVDVDSREGIALATYNDLLDYPAILVVREDGAVQNSWSGENLPLVDEVAGYARS